MPKSGVCEYCGVAFVRKKYAGPQDNYRFCGMPCHKNARFGEVVTDGAFKARSEAGLLALQMVRDGAPIIETAKQVGLTEVALRKLIYRNPGVFDNRVCQRCGKSLAGITALSHRKFCSNRCKSAFYHRIKAQNDPPKKLAAKQTLRKKGIELYGQGYSVIEMAELLDIPIDRATSWLRKHGGRFEEEFRNKRESAKSPEEWLAVLREYKLEPKSQSGGFDERENEHEEESHIFACKKIVSYSGYHSLVGKIKDELGLNPYSGKILVFCSLYRCTITTIHWSDTMFITTKYPRVGGGYIWLNEDIEDTGTHVAASKSDFDFILSYFKMNHKSRRIYLENTRKSIDRNAEMPDN